MLQATLRIPYGIVIGPGPETDIGSLIDDAGLFVTPTFAAGDVTITQDDGLGDDNIDALPSLDGTRVQLQLSAAEASPPAACNGVRVITLNDQTSPDAWIPIQIRIETEDHPLAYDTKGCIAALAGAAVGQTATNVRFASAPQNAPVKGAYVECRKAGNTPRSGIVKSYTAGATFDLTLYDAMPGGAIDDTWTIYVYADAPALAARLTGTEPSIIPTPTEIQAELEENGASTLDALEDRLTATRAGYLDNLAAGAAALEATAQAIHAKTTNLPTDPADQSLVIAATDAITAAIAALNDLSQAQAQTAAEAAIAIHFGAPITSAVATDVGNGPATFKTAADQGAKVLYGRVRLTSGALSGESKLAKWTGTQITVLSQTDMDASQKQFSATPADGITFSFLPI